VLSLIVTLLALGAAVITGIIGYAIERSASGDEDDVRTARRS